jgi:hypothetical protein
MFYEYGVFEPFAGSWGRNWSCLNLEVSFVTCFGSWGVSTWE